MNNELLPELISIFIKLPPIEQEHLIWIGEGILLSSEVDKDEEN